MKWLPLAGRVGSIELLGRSQLCDSALLNGPEPCADHQEQDNAPDAEKGVNEAPEYGDPTDRAEYERMGDDQETSRDAELNDPGVPERVAGSDQEWDCDDEVAESKPVESVRKERVDGVGL